MAKISRLLAAANLNGPERLPIVQNGETRGVSMTQLRTFFGDLLAGWHQGPQGETGLKGQDASQMAQAVEFSRAAGTLKTGDTAFELPFAAISASTVSLRGLKLSTSEYALAAGSSRLELTAPIEADEDNLAVSFFEPGNTLVPRLNVMTFGASGLDLFGNDDSHAFQRAFDVMAAVGANELEVPAGVYHFTRPVVYRGTNPIKVIGSAPTAGRAIAGDDQATILWMGAHDEVALTFETSGTSVANALNGVELENLLIAVPTAQWKGAGGVGLAFRGVYGGICRNVTVSGFDTGVLTDDNPSNAGNNSVRSGKISFYDLRVLQAASFRVRLRATAQCAFFNPSLLEESIPGYIADLSIEPGSNAGRSDGNTFYGGALIGPDDPASRPEFNVRLIDTIFNVFYGVAFERARVAACSVVANNFDYATNAYAAAFVNCWWDAQSGFCVDSNRARTMVIDPRCGAHTGGGAAFRFVGDPLGATSPRIGGGVRGGMIEFGGPEGIQIISATGVEVNGTEGRDASATGRPMVRVEGNCADTQLIGLRPHANTVPYVDEGTNTLILGREIKAQRWIIDPTFYAQIQDGNPVINFAPGLNITGNRAGDRLELFVGGNLVGFIDAGGFAGNVRSM